MVRVSLITSCLVPLGSLYHLRIDPWWLFFSFLSVWLVTFMIPPPPLRNVVPILPRRLPHQVNDRLGTVL